MTKQNLVLTGFMGTGKSTVGRILAERLALRFVDTDEMVVARDGRAIADIFREEGEAAFREMERTVAEELAEQTGLVIATGGRLMLDVHNAALLEQNGQVFCLTAVPEEIVARIMAEEGRRPLLAVPDPAARVRALLAERAEAYGRFHQIDTSDKTAEQVADEILGSLAGIRQSKEEAIMYFCDVENREVREIVPGVRMRTFWGELMLVSVVDLDADAIVPEHSHPHEQCGTVISGQMALTIAGETRWLSPGDAYIIPGDVKHSAQAGKEPAQVIDVFSPVRDEYKY